MPTVTIASLSAADSPVTVGTDAARLTSLDKEILGKMICAYDWDSMSDLDTFHKNMRRLSNELDAFSLPYLKGEMDFRISESNTFEIINKNLIARSLAIFEQVRVKY